jgi:hypothetical protein
MHRVSSAAAACLVLAVVTGTLDADARRPRRKPRFVSPHLAGVSIDRGGNFARYDTRSGYSVTKNFE